MVRFSLTNFAGKLNSLDAQVGHTINYVVSTHDHVIINQTHKEREYFIIFFFFFVLSRTSILPVSRTREPLYFEIDNNLFAEASNYSRSFRQSTIRIFMKFFWKSIKIRTVQFTLDTRNLNSLYCFSQKRLQKKNFTCTFHCAGKSKANPTRESQKPRTSMLVAADQKK